MRHFPAVLFEGTGIAIHEFYWSLGMDLHLLNLVIVQPRVLGPPLAE